MSDAIVEPSSLLNVLGNFFQYSLILGFGILIFRLYLNKDLDDKLPSKIPKKVEKAPKLESEIIVDVEKSHQLEFSTKETGIEPEGYDSRLHLFNRKLKEEYLKKEGFDPFKILEEMINESLNPDITTYNTLLDLCVGKNKIEWASALFAKLEMQKGESMMGKQVVADIFTYNTMLKGYCLQINEKSNKNQNIHNIEKCVSLIKQIDANEISYNTLLDACVRADEIDRALRYFNEMKEKNLKPDNVTYSTLIKGIKYHHASQRRDTKFRNTRQSFRNTFVDNGPALEKVFDLFNKAKKEKDMTPDEILYNCVIDACMKLENMKKAEELFKEMISSGIEPSLQTYSILIKGYGFEKNFDAVMEKCNMIVSKNLILNDHTYGALIDSCIKCEKFDHALQFYKEMKQNSSVIMNTYIYSSLIKGASNLKRFDKAFEIFNDMESNPDISPHIYAYNAMLDCAFKCGSHKIFEIYEKIVAKTNENFQADTFTYSVYLKALCKYDRIKEAFNLYEKIKGERFAIEEHIFNNLLHGLHKKQENDKALLVYQDMIANNIKPSDHTVSILIKIYGSQFMIDEALTQFKKYRENFIPGLILYTNIIQACVKCKKINEMLDIYKDMKVNGIECDEVLYNTIISGLTFTFHLKEAISVLNETFDKKIILKEEVYKTVLRNLYRKLNARFKAQNDLSQDEYEKILENIMSKMEDLKIELDPDVWTELQFSGLDDAEPGSRRRTDQMTSRNSYTKNSNVSRRTIF